MSETIPFAFTAWQRRVGIEREYKWSWDEPQALHFLDGRSIPDVLASIALPPDFRTVAQSTFMHRQETVYLDDRWRLLESESSLSVILNTGPTGEQSYVKAKQTVGWEGMRRDAVEIAEKVPADRVHTAIADGEMLPVAYFGRQLGPLTLRPFATTKQHRWKTTVLGRSGTPLTMCWDKCVIRGVDVAVAETAHCIEVETNVLDTRAAKEIAELEAAISRHLGMGASTLSKSRRAARMCGWRPEEVTEHGRALDRSGA